MKTELAKKHICFLKITDMWNLMINLLPVKKFCSQIQNRTANDNILNEAATAIKWALKLQQMLTCQMLTK